MFSKILHITCIFVFVIFVIVGACVGAVRSIDYIEENTYAAKSRIQKLIYAIVLGLLVMLYQGMSLVHFFFSLIITLIYNSILDDYPVIKMDNPLFLIAILGSIFNHFWLIKFFIDIDSGPFMIIFAFLTVWIIPFVFFLSFSAADNILFPETEKGSSGRIKTYAGLLKDFLLNIGKSRHRRNE